MKERRKAYMAGLMDTDGCIGIYVENPVHPKYSWHISFTNKCKPVVEWVSEVFGGTVKKVTKDSEDYWTWKPQGAEHANRFIQQVYPFLTIKKKEADLVIQYLALSGKRCPKDREILVSESKVLKKNRHLITDELNLFSYKSNLVQAYLAGLVDSDGSVEIRPSEYDKITIKVANKYRPLLKELVINFGGYIQPKADNNYEWRSCSVKNNERLLLKLLPNLMVKREQAQKALDILRHKLEKRKVSVENNTQGTSNDVMIDSDLAGDRESDAVVIQAS